MAEMITLITGPRAERRPPALRVRRRRAGAFTMVELLLVMVLICIILGATAPSLRGFFAARKTTSAAAQIMMLIQYARTQAIADGCNYRLYFDTTRNQVLADDPVLRGLRHHQHGVRDHLLAAGRLQLRHAGRPELHDHQLH